jgi:hypothetical protein
MTGLAMALSGCESPERYTQRRTEKLQAMYPAGTDRTDVEKRFEPLKPQISETRPGAGWDAFSKYPGMIPHITAVEQRSGKTVNRCDRYSAPDGFLSMSLCFAWFYYDAQDKVVEAEWEFQSD